MVAMLGPETVPIVILVAVVLFGGSKIPDLARSLGKAKGEFQKGLSEGDVKAEAPPAAPAVPAAPAPAAPPVAAPPAPATVDATAEGSETQQS